jgi:hypothetical protein
LFAVKEPESCTVPAPPVSKIEKVFPAEVTVAVVEIGGLTVIVALGVKVIPAENVKFPKTDKSEFKVRVPV